MPTNITANTAFGQPTAAVTWSEPTATDNSGIQTLASTHSPGSTFNIGVTVVTYTSVDAAGHETTRLFSVKVTGDELYDTKTKEFEGPKIGAKKTDLRQNLGLKLNFFETLKCKFSQNSSVILGKGRVLRN